MSGVAPDPPNRNLVSAELEQYLRDNGGPVRCCAYWPECSHMLEFIEQQQAHADLERIDRKGRVK